MKTQELVTRKFRVELYWDTEKTVDEIKQWALDEVGTYRKEVIEVTIDPHPDSPNRVFLIDVSYLVDVKQEEDDEGWED